LKPNFNDVGKSTNTTRPREIGQTYGSMFRLMRCRAHPAHLAHWPQTRPRQPYANVKPTEECVIRFHVLGPVCYCCCNSAHCPTSSCAIFQKFRTVLLINLKSIQHCSLFGKLYGGFHLTDTSGWVSMVVCPCVASLNSLGHLASSSLLRVCH